MARLHVAFSLLTLVPGGIGGSETYARGLLGAYAAAGGPRVTVLCTPAAAPSLAGAAGRPAEADAATRPLAGSARGPGGARPAAGRGAGAVRVRPVPVARMAAGGPARLAALAAGMALPAPVLGDADVVHHPLTVPVPPAPGRPVVVTLHDVLHHELPALFGRLERAFRALAYDGAARRAARVVTVTEHARREIVRHVGVPAGHVIAIQSGIDHARFRPDAGAGVPAPAGLPDRPWLLYPANLWPHKNNELLLAALAEGPRDLALVLTGATYGRLDALWATAARVGVGDRVVHLGHVPAASLAVLYRRAHAVVFPSLAEGFGFPPLEAMACGCPVAASDAGAVAEVCGDAALAFRANDVGAMAGALRRLAGDDVLRRELRERGLAHAARFTWAASAARHAEVYAAAAAR